MNCNRTAWCTLSTVLLICASISFASADRTHVMQPGETINGIARKYHVSIKSIAKLNHLRNVNAVPDYKKITLPSPTKIIAEPTMNRFAKVNGDGVSVRLGPGETLLKVDTRSKGDRVVVTAKKHNWYQIRLAGGKAGWVRADFLGLGKSAKPVIVAHKPKVTRHFASHLAVEKQKQKKHRSELAKVEHKSKKKSHSTQLAKHKKREVNRHQEPREYADAAESSGTGNDVVRSALGYRGTPYRYGGASRGGFDCSGFTSYLYGKKGISLPHTARGQFQHGKAVSHNSLKSGDLVFFHTVTPGISHVGMYIGNGKFVHSSSRRSGGVRVDNINSGYYRNAFRGGRRITK